MEIGFAVPILILVIVLALLKRKLPSTYNLLKRFTFWAFKSISIRLWRKPERKGGGSIKVPRMRWRP
jgi:hypothetical protein